MKAQGSPLTPEQAALAAEHFAWAKDFARRHARAARPVADEIESAVMLALCRAARADDASKGYCFRTLARRYLRCAVHDAKRRMAPPAAGRVLSVDEAPPIADEPAPGEQFESDTEIAALLSPLPARHRELMVRLYAHADTAAVPLAARSLGVCESVALRMHAEAVEMIRRNRGAAGPAQAKDGRAGTARARADAEARVVAAASALHAASGPFTLAALAAEVGMRHSSLGAIRRRLTARGEWPWPDPTARATRKRCKACGGCKLPEAFRPGHRVCRACQSAAESARQKSPEGKARLAAYRSRPEVKEHLAKARRRGVRPRALHLLQTYRWRLGRATDPAQAARIAAKIGELERELAALDERRRRAAS